MLGVWVMGVTNTVGVIAVGVDYLGGLRRGVFVFAYFIRIALMGAGRSALVAPAAWRIKAARVIRRRCSSPCSRGLRHAIG